MVLGQHIQYYFFDLKVLNVRNCAKFTAYSPPCRSVGLSTWDSCIQLKTMVILLISKPLKWVYQYIEKQSLSRFQRASTLRQSADRTASQRVYTRLLVKKVSKIQSLCDGHAYTAAPRHPLRQHPLALWSGGNNLH